MNELRQAFVEPLGFTPDRFQLESFDALDEGSHVIVAAPTGAGKTLIASYAVHRAVAAGLRVFYTTPIKALSNQKFNDLAKEYGQSRVGLLTGDNVINPDAPIIVMTTEVLRNMLYAGNPLDQLDAVVLDEVHYLQDSYRGPVWEEVIIHLPPEIQLVCLSATVSNAEQLRSWIETVRGTTRLIVETHRPVELENFYLVGERGSSQLTLMKTIVGGKGNAKGFRFDNDPKQAKRRGGGGRAQKGRPKQRARTPTRTETAQILNARKLLPAIYFIFSRQACDDAARSIVETGQSFTNTEERDEIRLLAAERSSALTEEDLRVLGYPRFLAALEAGVASHHAGMVPPLKELVEACFERGLVKLVFATETLALGINMPARTVVIEKLTKWTGEDHQFLTPAQFTQLTGRAGRRGIDEHGEAVVLWSPFVRFEQVAKLAKSREFTLVSAFRPTYNMAANLVRRHEAERARQLLNLSFAQYCVSAQVVTSEHQLDTLEARRHQLARRLEADFGSEESLRTALGTPGVTNADHGAIAHAMSMLTPGEVVRLEGDGTPDLAIVLSISVRKGGRVRAHVVDAEGATYDVLPVNLEVDPAVLGHISLPVPYLPNSATFINDASKRLAKSKLVRGSNGASDARVGAKTADDVPALARKGLRKIDRIDGEIVDLRRAIQADFDSLARQFDRVIELLESRGHMDGWELTATGERIARLYHESDLFIVEAMEAGIFDDLSPAELAAVVSMCVFESRGRDEGGTPYFPTTESRRRFGDLLALHHDLNKAERKQLLNQTRAPDAGFAGIVHAWALGHDLSDLAAERDLTPGDFVRTIKLLVDLLKQIGQLAPKAETARAARQAADMVFRDLVAVTTDFEGANDTEPDDTEPDEAESANGDS